MESERFRRNSEPLEGLPGGVLNSFVTSLSLAPPAFCVPGKVQASAWDCKQPAHKPTCSQGNLLLRNLLIRQPAHRATCS